jgi:DNA-binding NarL/FixJ family response regulator
MESLPGIMIVDDHSLFREGLKLLVEHEGMGHVIAEAGNGEVFLRQLREQKPDLVLMDIEMPVMSGLEATIKARALYPDLKILVVTMLFTSDIYTDVINAGALGFVLKTSGKNELERAIKAVLGGDCFFSNELLRQIIANFNKPVRSEKVNDETDITQREMEILNLLCEGLTITEIAEKLFRSVKTIEAHRSKMLEKTGTRNTINLILYAIRNNLVRI